MTRAQTAFLAIIFLWSGTAGTNAAPDELAAAENTYKTKLASVNHNYLQAISTAISQYKADIDAYAALGKRTGDLDAAIAARDEINRYNDQKTVPEESAPDLPAPLALARTKYHERIAVALQDKNRNILALVNQYTSYLESLQKTLVAADKLDKAIAIKKIIETVQSSAPVTAAKFSVADDSTKTAEPTPADAEPTAANAKTEYETIEYDKKIGARGGLTHDWSPTTLRLQEGDEVTIKANGSWQCTYQSTACGPAGYPYANSTALKFRRDPALNYGALICKYGTKGRIINVGLTTTFTTDTGGVLLYLDANILPGRTHRKDCAGDLTVNVTVKRKK